MFQMPRYCIVSWNFYLAFRIYLINVECKSAIPQTEGGYTLSPTSVLSTKQPSKHS